MLFIVPAVTEIPLTVVVVPPVDESVLILFRKILSLPAPVAMPVIMPAPPILVMVLLVVELVVPLILTLIAVIAPVPPVQLLKVLFCMVWAAAPASVNTHPAMTVAPVTVMFEKLLPLLLITLPDGEVAALVNSVTVPPAPPLLKMPDILLLFK